MKKIKLVKRGKELQTTAYLMQKSLHNTSQLLNELYDGITSTNYIDNIRQCRRLENYFNENESILADTHKNTNRAIEFYIRLLNTLIDDLGDYYEGDNGYIERDR